MGLKDPLAPDMEGEIVYARQATTIPRCPKCRTVFGAGEDACPICCIAPICLRGQYDEDGRCKRHADEHRYAKMRELEHHCRRGIRVRCLANHEWLAGTALSGVRLVPKDIPTRGRWPSVIVKLDGHHESVEWPAIDVELLHDGDIGRVA
jgi:hypothetical protein